MTKKQKSLAGFTLLEMVLTCVIIGVMAVGGVAFFKLPIEAYMAAQRRAMLHQSSVSSTNFMRRELRLALPNSVRVTTSGGITYLEFLPVHGAGRYRSSSATGTDPAPVCAADSALLPDNGVLDIGHADSCFKTIGDPDLSLAVAGDWVVVFNMGPGYANADAYESGNVTGGNKSAFSAVTAGTNEKRVAFASTTFQFDSPSRRFFITGGPVSYVCDPSAGVGALTRYTGYAMRAAQPTTFAGSTNAYILKNVSACAITYQPGGLTSRYGIVSGRFTLTLAGEAVNLGFEARMSNKP